MNQLQFNEAHSCYNFSISGCYLSLPSMLSVHPHPLPLTCGLQIMNMCASVYTKMPETRSCPEREDSDRTLIQCKMYYGPMPNFQNRIFFPRFNYIKINKACFFADWKDGIRNKIHDLGKCPQNMNVCAQEGIFAKWELVIALEISYR